MNSNTRAENREAWPGALPAAAVLRKRRWTPAWVIIAGCAAAAAGWALGHTTLLVAWKAGNASQVNGLCFSAIGQLGQAMNAGVRSKCGEVALYEQASGWLIVAGILAVAGGIAWAAWQRHAA